MQNYEQNKNSASKGFEDSKYLLTHERSGEDDDITVKVALESFNSSQNLAG